MQPPDDHLLGRINAVLRPVLVSVPAMGTLAGFAAHFMSSDHLAGLIWSAAALPVLVALLVEIVMSLRRGDVGLDLVAALSMSVALLFGESLAAVVVALMYAGGQYLESYAEGRAGREMTALLSRMPRSALRHKGERLEEIGLDAIRPGDRILVRQGEVVPVDGVVAGRLAVLDQSALTGESMPIQQPSGGPVMSGSTNVGEAFDLTATRLAAESAYAAVIRLVEAAQRSKAPMSRLADRYAVAFLVITVVMAGGAWLWSGDPIRALAVLVIATPCPLILAVPIAIVAGLSRAAKVGVLVKGGKALEALAGVQALVLDKTGTLTHGEAQVVEIHATPGFSDSDVLRLAASLDQASKHVIARALVREAQVRAVDLLVPTDVVETPGEGVAGVIQGRSVLVGGASFVKNRIETGSEPLDAVTGTAIVAVAVDGRVAGHMVVSDPLRKEAARLIQDLRDLGLARVVLASGDRQDVVDAVAAALPLDVAHGAVGPEEKIAIVNAEKRHGPVMMVGDGINDAPALAAADVGVAMGAKGAVGSTEVADVVILVDELDRVNSAVRIARRSRRIALESVFVGMGLSLLGMIAAFLGYLTPVQGALIQELIDVAAILNALRALRAH
jgi:heavy metal translocating P-type ATPase